jgi:hypothetical protein
MPRSALLRVGVRNLWSPLYKTLRLWIIFEVHSATTMKMEVPGFSETLVTYQTGRCRAPEENSLLIAILWFMAPTKLHLKW